MMRLHTVFGITLAWSVLAGLSWASGPVITGDYVEIRSCDVYTGPCFANGEMGLAVQFDDAGRRSAYLGTFSL